VKNIVVVPDENVAVCKRDNHPSELQ